MTQRRLTRGVRLNRVMRDFSNKANDEALIKDSFQLHLCRPEVGNQSRAKLIGVIQSFGFIQQSNHAPSILPEGSRRSRFLIH